MPLPNSVIVLVVVGVALWVINSYIPMQSTIDRAVELARSFKDVKSVENGLVR
jgi:hypothetical protein